MCETALYDFESEKHGGRSSGINDVCLFPAYKLVRDTAAKQWLWVNVRQTLQHYFVGLRKTLTARM